MTSETTGGTDLPLPSKPEPWKPFLRKGTFLLAALLVAAAIVSSLFRALTPFASQYRGELEHRLSTWVGQPVTIASMETGWYWFHPVLKLRDVNLSGTKHDAVHLQKLLVGINVFKSLMNWQIQPGVLYVEGLRLGVRQEDDGFVLDGLEMKNASFMGMDAFKAILHWLLQQQKVVIKDMSLRLYLRDGNLVPIEGARLIAVNRDGHYTLRASAQLAQTIPTHFRMLATLDINPWAIMRARGKWYIETENLLPAQWQALFPAGTPHVDGGTLDAQIWLDMARARVKSGQARLSLENLALTEPLSGQSTLFQSIEANTALRVLDNSWEVEADKLDVRVNGVTWPQNAFVLRVKDTGQVAFYVKNLLIESLLSTAFPWPQSMDALLALKPHGTLTDASVHWNNGTLEAVLGRFEGLGWQPNKTLAGANNLTGALAWQPGEGRLELDSENAAIRFPGKPELLLQTLNGALDWKQLTNGLRLSLERLVLVSGGSTLTAEGLLDNADLSEGRGNLRLESVLAAKEAASILQYLPADSMKPKLAHWLQNDITRIKGLNARLRMQGELEHFPWDKGDGEFDITGQAEGIDLYFDRKWPEIRGIDAWLHLNGRTLEANITHASHGPLTIDKGNLKLVNIGLDREYLLIRTALMTPGPDALDYLLSTPLAKPLAKLRQVQIEGPLDANLQLEVPLYPGNDNLLARGAVSFSKNPVTVNHPLHRVALNNVQGTLYFDEHGPTPSNLEAEVFNTPVTLTANTRQTPQPLTEIGMQGTVTVASLRSQFNSPLLDSMKGVLPLSMLLTMTDNPNDMDSVRFTSTLLGTAVDLPPPFGKSATDTRPVSVDIDFNPEKAARIRFQDEWRARGDIWFAKAQTGFMLKSGAVAVGRVALARQPQQGLRVDARLDTLDVEKWLQATGKHEGAFTPSMLPDDLNLQVKTLQLWGNRFEDVTLNSHRRRDTLWAFTVKSPLARAQLGYDTAKNLLSGHIDQLTLSSTGKHDTSSEPLPLRASSIPNLALTVDNLRLKEHSLGVLTVRGKPLKDGWSLDALSLESPAWTLNGQGTWTQNGVKDVTQVDTSLRVRNLAALLALWDAPPAVLSKKGEARLVGSWPGGFQDFSTKKLSGEFWMRLRNGRITHLSREAEEKMDLGRVLSILSLQTIPRRLQLDFSDLTEQGYSFDVFEGNFALKKGIVTTDNAHIDGPVAFAAIKGQIDLPRETLDLHLRVAPRITASLPIVATIAGGPIAGVAAWVVSRLINAGMEKVSGYTYKVSGPFKDPLVQQTSITTLGRKKKP